MGELITTELVVRNKEMRVRKRDNLTTGQVGNKIQFIFEDNTWNISGDKQIIFKVDTQQTGENRYYTRESTFDTDTNTTIIPWEICQSQYLGGIVYVGLRLIRASTTVFTYIPTGSTTRVTCYKYGDNYYTDSAHTIQIISATELATVQATYEVVYPTIYTRLGVVEQGSEATGTVISSDPTITEFDQAITLAKSWAVGPSGTGSGTDSNNSKYYSQQSSSSATIAKSWAVGPNGTGSGTDSNNSKYYSQQSSSSATIAKSWAVGPNGTGSGTDSNNAKYWSIQAADSADLAADSADAADVSADAASASATTAKNWAVGPSGTGEGTDTNNAKYWNTQANTAASHYPQIDTTTHHWKVWNVSTSAWEDTGVLAEFTIRKTYSTVADMMADYSGTDTSIGDFVMINGDVELTDTGKLYVKVADTTTKFSYIADLSGARGIQGPTGAAAGFGTPTATIDSTVGTPAITITSEGPDTAKIFNFAFSNLKGETGSAAGFGTPTATIDSSVGTPAVSITSSGPDTAKIFNFAFSNLKGTDVDHITRTSGTGQAGSLDTYTMYASDSSVIGTFTVQNGLNGTGIGDMLQANYDPIPTGETQHPVITAGGIPAYISGLAYTAAEVDTVWDSIFNPTT